MIHQEYHLMLAKEVKRRTPDDSLNKDLYGLIEFVNNRSIEMEGWTIEADEVEHDEPGDERVWISQEEFQDAIRFIPKPVKDASHRFEMYLKVIYQRRDDKEPLPHRLPGILSTIFTRSALPVAGRWTLETVDGKEYVPPDPEATRLSSDFVGYADIAIPEDFKSHFSHLFGLDNHIVRIKGALDRAISSNFDKRYHCALIGPPGCGKSDVARTFKAALGDEAVIEYDATATTAAGMIKDLSEREILPRVMVVEEIEKADPKSLLALLSILDFRAEIRKNTARQTIQRDTRLWAIATVNNTELFESLAAGALASRFPHKVYFKRPSRDLLTKILEREIDSVDGNISWIDPALDYCEEFKIDDPRQVTALCLSGADDWLNEEYRKVLAATSNHVEEETRLGEVAFTLGDESEDEEMIGDLTFES